MQAFEDLIASNLAHLPALDDAAFRARPFVRNVLITTGNSTDLPPAHPAAYLTIRHQPGRGRGGAMALVRLHAKALP